MKIAVNLTVERNGLQLPRQSALLRCVCAGVIIILATVGMDRWTDLLSIGVFASNAFGGNAVPEPQSL